MLLWLTKLYFRLNANSALFARKQGIQIYATFWQFIWLGVVRIERSYIDLYNRYIKIGMYFHRSMCMRCAIFLTCASTVHPVANVSQQHFDSARYASPFLSQPNHTLFEGGLAVVGIAHSSRTRVRTDQAYTAA